MSHDPRLKRNRLSQSHSPYLLQHAGNPVDWWEWGEAAFEEARKRDVPVFLSIGYSTCHWCHVMAHESFEDEGIASRMNNLFVNIKVDREERPDVDRIYMSYVQATTGSGGWPMSVWLTPQLKPFYGGTYFPPEDRYGRVGFLTLIERIGNLWKNDRETLLEYGEKSVQLLEDNASRALHGGIEGAAEAIDLCLSQLESEYDEVWGGFGGAPKFPMPSYFALLIESIARGGKEALGEMLVETLEKMASGGIWDHVGGGFHRYSVDRYWHVPHYEKMLYDQGQLAAVYAEAYRLTGRETFRQVSCGIISYVLRDMRGARGQLFAAEDADSEKADASGGHGEGAFYVWSSRELNTILGDRFGLFKAAFDIKLAGNARPESDPHGELAGMNTLMRVGTTDSLARDFGLSPVEVDAALRDCLRKLLKARESRHRPHRDEKVLASWSGLMIGGACRVYQTTGDEGARDLAREAAVFVWEGMWNAQERRLSRLPGREQGGFAEDYAAVAGAFIDLFECTFDTAWLARSRSLLEAMCDRFLDTERGGFFATEKGSADALVRLRDDYDGAEPAASSLAALAMLRLAALLDQECWRTLARETIEAFGEQWRRAPRAMSLMLVAASRFLEADQQIVVVGKGSENLTSELLRAANRFRMPYSVLVYLDTEQTFPAVFSDNEKLRAMYEAGNEEPLAYVCEDYACREPVRDLEGLKEALR